MQPEIVILSAVEGTSPTRVMSRVRQLPDEVLDLALDGTAMPRALCLHFGRDHAHQHLPTAPARLDAYQL
jgi:hypothetical protein